MATTLYELNLDFSKELNYSKAIMARQGDKGVTIAVNAYLHGLPMVTDSNGIFTLKATTPSGLYVDAPTTSVNGNHLMFELNGTFISESGYYQRCYVEYRTPDKVYTTQDIIFFATKVSDITQGQADIYLSQLEQLIDEYNKTFNAFMAEIEGKATDIENRLNASDATMQALEEQLERIKAEINTIDLGAFTKMLEDHIADETNPHNVTKAQTGLGNVENYKVATKTEAQDGVSNTAYMTPQQTTNQLDGRLASQIDALVGVDNTHLMTPLRVKQFNDSLTITKRFTGNDLQQVKLGTIDITRINNIVIMSGSVNTLDDANANNNNTFVPLVLPVGFRPTTEVPVNHYVPAMFDIFFGRVQTNGNVQLKVAMNNSHAHLISGTWVTADEMPEQTNSIIPRPQYINALNEFRNSLDKSKFNIGITTDAHYDENTWRTQAYRSLRNLNNILYVQNDVDVLLALGDNVDSEHKDKSINIANLERYVERFSQGDNTNKMIIRGNHDSGSLPWDTSNEGNKVPSSAVLSDIDQLNIFKKYLSQEGKVYNTEGSYHYKDFPDDKIRIIMVDTIDNGAITNPNGTLKYTDQWDFGIRQEQFRWIANQALGTLPNDYHVVICTHVPVQPQGVEEGALRNADVMRTLLNAFVNKTTAELRSTITDFTVNLDVDFSSRTQSNLIGLFAGHRHEEFFYNPTQMGGFYSTVLDCAFVRDNSKIGTPEEDAFSVISIDINERAVYRSGFGRQSSLLYNY